MRLIFFVLFMYFFTVAPVETSHEQIYADFLSGKTTAIWDGDIIAIDDILSYGKDWQYTFFDMTGDGLPELHLNSGGNYVIMSIDESKRLYIWFHKLQFAGRITLLNDSSLISEIILAAPKHHVYKYTILDVNGKVRFEQEFEYYEKDYSKACEFPVESYFFDGTEVTESVWNGLTNRYLSLGNDLIPKWKML